MFLLAVCRLRRFSVKVIKMRYSKPLHSGDRLLTVSGAGSPDIDERILTKLDSGAKTLVVTGKTSLYDRIQSYANKVDLAQLIRRYNAGDTQALNRTVGDFIDVSDVPSDLRELMHRASVGAQVINQLSPDQLDRLMRGEPLESAPPSPNSSAIPNEEVSADEP